VEGKVRCNGVEECPDGKAEGCIAKESTGSIAADGVATTCTLTPGFGILGSHYAIVCRGDRKWDMYTSKSGDCK
jgi:hypothetical protein